MTQSLTLDKKRIASIDLLRGLVMIIMALDHTRDFTHTTAWTEDPLSMQTTTPVLYFTRWITHFCAPVFVFLSGMSAFLQSKRKTKKELSVFLVTRGFWLILVEIFIVNLIFTFDISFSVIGLQVIWAIGISMLLLGLAIWLPFPVIFAIGILIVLGHNALDFYEKDHKGPFNHWYELLHRPGFNVPFVGNTRLLILYPFLSWLGLMFCGYCFGKLVSDRQGAARKKLLLITGFSLILLFIVLRYSNEYGDPALWSEQKNGLFTFLSYMNVTKYPPSLLYMCATIGPALIFMAFFNEAKSGIAKMISVYGRVAFFYYILHFFILHLVCVILFFINGHSLSESNSANLGVLFVVPGEGVPLWGVYLVWIAVVIILYPLCRWYDNYKTRHKEKKWLSYL
ncbi:MAG: DUF1624 domain-containing protein [Chitinophagaceae bacterium]|nr:DUF1624 domain-containing protein [Chitinophagaceae bacterium]